MHPPVARVDVVRDTHFGTTVEDPYRWMEEPSPEFDAWVDGQAAYARSILDALPDRDAWLARIRELRGGTTQEFGFHGQFHLRQKPTEPVPVLMTGERLLLDPNESHGPEHSFLDFFVPSPDGRWVACGISAGGAEIATLRILDVATVLLLDDAIPNLRVPFVSWLDDNASLLYHRFPEPSPDTPPDERRLGSYSALHRLGDDPDSDQVILASGVNPNLPLTPRDRPFLVRPPDGRWLLAVVSHSAIRGDLTAHDLHDCSFFLAPLDSVTAPENIPWVRVAAAEEAVDAYAFGEDTLYLVRHGATPMGEVLAVPLDDPDLARARVVVPQGGRVVEAIQIVGDHLLVRELEIGVARLRRVPLTGNGPAEEVPLPVDGSIMEWSDDAGGMLLRIESWTSPPRTYRYDAATGLVAAADAAGVGGDIEVSRAYAPARDGTLIPMTLLHRRGVPLDGSNPTYLTGYGSYGLTPTPAYKPGILAWLERGGIWAVGHLRGGGDLGQAWHHAGRRLRKENTITDFVDCAEYLIARGYTTPARLVGSGGSAGGIPSGGSLVRRPELWAVMVMHVPLADTLRFEFSENGPMNVPEFGSVGTEDGLQALRIIDAYRRVTPGTPYPAVYLTAGRNDPRVPVWQPGKMAAALQAATASGHPVLLRIEEHGGHGFGSTADQDALEWADELAYLWDRLHSRR